MSLIPYLDELGDALEAAITRSQAKRRATAPVAFGVAFLAIVAIGGAWWFLRPAQPGVAAQTTTTMAAATEVAVGELADLEFARVPPTDALVDGAQMFLSDVVVIDGEFVAVGSGESGAVIMASADGVDWLRRPAPGAATSLDTALVNRDGLVVGGIDSAFGPAAWRVAPDGEWHRLPLPARGYAVAAVRGFAEVDGSLVAVGQGIAGEAADDEVSAVVWRETDGLWEQVSGGPLSGVAEVDATGIAHAAGTTVVSGVWSEVEGEHRAVAWVSTDLETWTRIALPLLDDTNPRSYATDVIWSGDRFVAAGGGWFGSSRVAAVWTSDDGVNWAAVPHDPEVFGAGRGELRLNTLTRLDDRLLALGIATDGPAGHPVVLSSPDGAAWTRTDLGTTPAEWVMAAGAAQRGDIVVLAGGDGTGGAVWVSPVPPGLASATPLPAFEEPEGMTVLVEPDMATPASRVKVEVDLAGASRPDADVAIVLVGSSGEFQACTITLAAGLPPWCDFHPEDVGLIESMPLTAEARVGDDVVATSRFEIVPPGTPVVRLAVSYTPWTDPFVQSVSARNLGDVPLDLGGWSLATANGEPAYTFPAGTVLEPGQAAGVIAGGNGATNCGNMNGFHLIACRPRGADTNVGPLMESFAPGILLLDQAGLEADAWSMVDER